MIAALVAACLVATGVALSEAWVAARRPAERFAFAWLFAVTVIPFTVVAVALAASVRLSDPLLLGVSLVATLGAAWAWRRSRGRDRADDSRGKDTDAPATARSEALLVAGGLVVAGASLVYYNGTEFLLSLASYVTRGEAKCFYMLTFRMLSDLNPPVPFVPLRDVYDIISTPGNVVFSAPFVQAFGAAGLQVAYAAVNVLAFLFVGLIALRWTRRGWIAVLAGVFAVASPYALSIEVLDRNAIALALTAAFFYTVETRPNRAVLHGWLFAVAAGTGLRFLPLLNVAFVLCAYVATKATARRWLLFGVTAGVAFAPNVPHLAFHAFHSLGETLGPWDLAVLAVTRGYRAPFQALPPGLQYLLQALGHLGALGAAAVLLGATRAWSTRRREALTLAVVTGFVWLVLACERDWMEGDKARILLSAWLPIPLFLALALDRLSLPRGRLKATVLLVAALALAVAADVGLRRIEAPVDPGSSERKPVYQSDTDAFARFYRSSMAPVGLLPGWGALDGKLDLAGKRRLQRTTAATLAPSVLSSLPAGAAWATRCFDVAPPDLAAPPGDAAAAVSVRIDLERLVTEPEAAATLAPSDAEPFVDLSAPADLLDVYFKKTRVSWQPQSLPIVVFPRRLEHAVQNEVVLHLNAYTSLGPDAEGFERVNAIQYDQTFASRAEGRRTGLRALPHADERPAVVVKIPPGARIVVQAWIVSLAKGTPFRVDSWEITLDASGQPRVRFLAGEPESYL